MSHSPKRLFLIQPLDAEPPQVPKNARVVSADDEETLLHAQSVQDAVFDLIAGKISFKELRQRLRSSNS